VSADRAAWDAVLAHLAGVSSAELVNYVLSPEARTRVIRIDLAYAAQEVLAQRGHLVTPRPLHQRSLTSRLAALERERVTEEHERIVAFVRGQGEEGATRDEIARNLGMYPGTVCARVFELISLRRLVSTSRTRLTLRNRLARVLTAT
jgi:DNA-binding NarL/FixJ family response regulator